MDPRIESHVMEIDKCNQRGGRMLSIRDLLDAGTLDRKMSEYLLAAISGGRSFLVGAMPGGAGKTTVMGALLNFIPDIDIVPTVNGDVIRDGLDDETPRCYLAHEIGRGRWYAYIWGRDVENFLHLTCRHMVAGNLHADDIEDVLSHDGIDESNITKLDLLIFLSVNGGLRGRSRRINSILENQGGRGTLAFKQIYSCRPPDGPFVYSGRPKLVTERELEWAGEVMESVLIDDLRTIGEVRSAVLKALPSRNI
jgi:hypothetical protein